MAQFNRNNKGGSGKFGKRSFGGRDNRPIMHDAVCNKCGRRCQVPFRPTGERPVYCSDCFGKERGSSMPMPQRNEERNFDPKGKGGVYTDAYKEKFEALNAKLDEILNMLTPKTPDKLMREKPAKKAVVAKKAKKK